MRVADSMVRELNLAALQRVQGEHFEAQTEAQTGVRVAEPSDDPVDAGLARGARSREMRSESLARITDRSLTHLVSVDETLASVNDTLARARELAVQGANDTMSPADRQSLASEVRALRRQLLDLGNTRIDGEYVFAGLATDRAPFDDTGAFLGDPRTRQIEVAPGVRIDVQLAGDQVFGTAAGGTNAFDTLEAVAGALEADDGDQVAALLAELTAVVDQGAVARTRAGTQQEALIQARALAERARDTARVRHGELVRAENALRQAITLSARVAPPGLLEQ